MLLQDFFGLFVLSFRHHFEIEITFISINAIHSYSSGFLTDFFFIWLSKTYQPFKTAEMYFDQSHVINLFIHICFTSRYGL